MKNSWNVSVSLVKFSENIYVNFYWFGKTVHEYIYIVNNSWDHDP
jgi:hypothetical protein